MLTMTVENIRSFLAGKPVNVVTPLTNWRSATIAGTPRRARETGNGSAK